MKVPAHEPPLQLRGDPYDESPLEIAKRHPLLMPLDENATSEDAYHSVRAWLESGRWVIAELHAVLLILATSIYAADDHKETLAAAAKLYDIDLEKIRAKALADRR